ncbi:MAG: enoyl-CoA hydratase [Paraglaciecola sp.]
MLLDGQAGMFSGGYDLKIMLVIATAEIALGEKGSTVTRRMLLFPFPLLATYSGHVVAKGTFLLLAADFRIGLNEVAIGMTMHHGGVELIKGRLAPVF